MQWKYAAFWLSCLFRLSSHDFSVDQSFSNFLLLTKKYCTKLLSPHSQSPLTRAQSVALLVWGMGFLSLASAPTEFNKSFTFRGNGHRVRLMLRALEKSHSWCHLSFISLWVRSSPWEYYNSFIDLKGAALIFTAEDLSASIYKAVPRPFSGCRSLVMRV